MPVVINGSTGISGVDGSAGTPAFQGSDTNTGIRFGTDIVSLVTGGSDRLYIDSSGRLGVGTTSPSTLLHLNSSSASAVYLRLENTGGYAYFGVDGSGNAYAGAESNDAFGIVTNGTYRMYITAGGNVGIGTTSPDALLCFAGATGKKVNFYQGSDYSIGVEASQLRIAAVYNTVIYRGGYSGSETARFDLDGRLLVGTSTAPSTGSLQYSKLFISGNTAGSGGSQIAVTRGQAFNGLASGQDLGYVYFGTYDGGEYGVITCFSDGASTASSTPGRLEFRTTASGATSPTERMRITNAGRLKVSNTGSYQSSSDNVHEISNNVTGDWALGVNTTSSTGDVYCILQTIANQAPNNSTSAFLRGRDSTGNSRYLIYSNGGLANYQSNNSNLCDEREKKNIENLESTWNCLKDWQLKKFHYNEDDDAEAKRYGVIAQQVEQHCPEVITNWNKGEDEHGNVITRKGVKEQQMYWMAIKALQEAQVRIEQLEARLTAAGIE